MSDAESQERTSISHAESLEEIGEFWDGHSLADHWDQTEEADFEVRAHRRRRVTIDPEVYAQVVAAAHQRGVSAETLINLWLTRQVEQAQAAPEIQPQES